MRQSFSSAATLGATAVFTLLSLPVSAVAQETSVLEEVVVTGSNIRRDRDFDTPSPIQTLGLEEISAAGAGQVQDLLKTLTVNAGSELATSQNGRQGLSQFSLRGLGLSGTLMLVNGRRAGLSPVASDDGFFFTDVNQYPVNMIERVEVLTDGASATYGSEAVGGVVNVMTRDDFEGAEFGLELRDANNSAYQLNAAFGSSFEKGRFATFMNYYRQSGLFRGEFDWLRERDNGGNQLHRGSSWDSGTGASYGYALTDGDARFSSGTATVDAHCGQPNAIGVVNTFNDRGSNCRYSFIDQRRLTPEEQRFQSFTTFAYDLSDNVSLFSELSFSSNKIHDGIGGAVLRRTTDGNGFLVPADHPFNYFIDAGDNGAGSNDISWDPAAIAAGTAAVDVIFHGRPLITADGALADDIVRKHDNTRAVLGVDVDLSATWSLNAYYMFSRSQFSDKQPRSYNSDAFRAAIQSGQWNPFGISWADPSAVSVKDDFSVAGNTADDLELFAANRVFQAEAVQQVMEVTASGELMEMAGGTLLAAIGAQYRQFDYDDIADSLSEFRLDGRADPVFSINGETQDVYALYGEVIAPVTQALELQLALRYEDYGDGEGGDTVDPKIGAQWHVTDAFTLRGSYGTSFQAPSIRNIAGAVGSGALDDRATALSAGANCAADPDSFNAAQITTGGDLDPQSAINYNFGAVLLIEKFTGSLDYWVYEYEDLIQTGDDFQDILDNECPDGGTYSPDPRVVRDPSGQLNSITSSFVNVGQVDTAGIDLNASYLFDGVFGGSLTAALTATLILDFDIDQAGTGTAFDGAGNRNRFIGFGSLPSTRLNVSLNWFNDRHSASLAARFIGSYDDRTPTDATTEGIDSQLVLDVQYGIDLDVFGEGATNVTVGVNNLLDEDPPEIFSDRIVHDGEVHSPIGRAIYVRAKYSF